MKYRFKDIRNITKAPDMRVLAITGSHNIFIDLIFNDIKNDINVQSASFALGDSNNDEFDTIDEKESSLDFDTFIKVCHNLSPMGKWFCKVNWDFLTKKNKERVKTYIKKPSEYAMLIIVAQEWKNIKELRSIRTFDASKTAHLIDIQYPNKSELEAITTRLFAERGMRIGEDSARLFMLKLGTAYDEYKPNIEIIYDKLDIQQRIKDASSENNGDSSEIVNINIKEFKESMLGIDYFVLDDFLLQLLVPIHSKKIVKKRRLYKMLSTLLDDFTAKEICTKLKYKIEELMHYRAYINNGCIPVRTRYNCEKIKERIPEDSKLRKASAPTFKRNAYTASLTSIEDWYFMYTMLCRNRYSDNDDQYLVTLVALMGRTAVSNDRLMNDIRVKNTLDEGLTALNGLYLTEQYRQFVMEKASLAEK